MKSPQTELVCPECLTAHCKHCKCDKCEEEIVINLRTNDQTK